jgi:hypothetical protein
MMPTLSLRRIGAITCAFAFALTASAQKPPAIPTNTGTLSMKATIGSFKLVRHSDQDPAKGHFEVSFSGSLLLSGLDPKGTVQTTGSLRLEYYNKQHNERVYYGTGKIVVDGTLLAIQCFGNNIEGTFIGRAIFHLAGEFDKDGKTGAYWYGQFADTRAERQIWETSGTEVKLPEDRIEAPANTVPTPRKGGG